MRIFTLGQIEVQPFIVIAEDGEHAEQLLGYAMMVGLTNRPGLSITVSEWTNGAVARFPVLKRWAGENCGPGIVWQVDDDGKGWELVRYDFHRP